MMMMMMNEKKTSIKCRGNRLFKRKCRWRLPENFKLAEDSHSSSSRPRGPMDKASAYGAGDCRFESCRGHILHISIACSASSQSVRPTCNFLLSNTMLSLPLLIFRRFHLWILLELMHRNAGLSLLQPKVSSREKGGKRERERERCEH